MQNEKEIKETIEELKNTAMQYVRTAANLDMCIRQLETEMDNGPKYVNMTVNMMCRNRIEMMQTCYGNLEEQEILYWQALSKYTKQES